jgi:hypothetical protein
MTLTDPARKLVAVHSRHRLVGHDNMRRPGSENELACCDAIGCGGRVVPGVAKDALDKGTNG